MCDILPHAKFELFATSSFGFKLSGGKFAYIYLMNKDLKFLKSGQFLPMTGAFLKKDWSFFSRGHEVGP